MYPHNIVDEEPSRTYAAAKSECKVCRIGYRGVKLAVGGEKAGGLEGVGIRIALRIVKDAPTSNQVHVTIESR